GIGRLVGPTGGFLIGYLPTVFIIGKIAQNNRPRWMTDVLAMICGTLVLYACGVSWLKMVSGMPLAKTLVLGMYPFLIGDALKIAAATAIARALRPVVGIPAKS
ncbi:MAG: biotin transporter BioY, partial [Deltaproteobacteria bacterium]|nr:biotin transporter BioY [Deltaproteobacteria bacterium]